MCVGFYNVPCRLAKCVKGFAVGHTERYRCIPIRPRGGPLCSNDDGKKLIGLRIVLDFSSLMW